MGPTKYRLGGGTGSATGAAPSAPGNGSGGGGSLLSLSPAIGEISDVTTGRITLAMLDFVILGMLAFYWWTRSSQAG
jgi:hypothetical protein